MAPLRVIFLMIVIATVVTVSGGTSTRGASKLTKIKSQITDKVRSLSGNSQAKGWSKSANNKFKSIADSHPGLKEKGLKVWSKFSGMKKSNKKGNKPRGLVNNAGSKARGLAQTVKKDVNTLKSFIRNAKAAAALHSKVSGLTKSFSKTRGLGGGAAIKNSIRSTTDKFTAVKNSGTNKIKSVKDNSLTKLTSMKESSAFQNLQNKMPASGLKKLKNLPAADKLKGLASNLPAKGKFSPLKTAAGKLGA